MKIRAVSIAGCLIAVVVLFIGFEGPQMLSIAFAGPESSPSEGLGEYSRAEAKEAPAVLLRKDEAAGALKIGVVSVKRIFKDCKASVRYRAEAVAERERLNAELEKLAKEIEAGQAGLKALKVGTGDHLALTREILEKQGSLQVREEFGKQQATLKDYRWTRELYEDILRETGEVARQKGLDLVFEKDEIDIAALSVSELGLTIGTHKLLYSGGCPDITDEVMARLDAKN